MTSWSQIVYIILREFAELAAPKLVQGSSTPKWVTDGHLFSTLLLYYPCRGAFQKLSCLARNSPVMAVPPCASQTRGIRRGGRTPSVGIVFSGGIALSVRSARPNWWKHWWKHWSWLKHFKQQHHDDIQKIQAIHRNKLLASSFFRIRELTIPGLPSWNIHFHFNVEIKFN